ncbi:MAG: 3-dehydroquinate synthase [Acidobacteria bacterium]|nr:3-dehydroquinate synthase [Acidobacteriota bacterium]
MMRIPVHTEHSCYEAVVERGALEHASEHLGPLVRGRKVFVLSTESVWRWQGARLERGLRGTAFLRLSMPDGEEHKRLSTLEALAEQMLAAGADRSSVVVAFGGGITNDVGGFLAAIYMRGIDVIQIPTTLLAQVDAAIGGKTGVNLAKGKNLLGAFHQPRLVLIDPGTLDSLPEREYRAGLYEVIKCAIIARPGLFQLLAGSREAVLARAPSVVDELIRESVRIKAEVVSADEREGDRRRILNFGHTLGHALEAETDYRHLLHGEAVAFGMRAATWLAEKAGVLAGADCSRIQALVEEYGPIPSLAGIRAENLVARLGSDKKTIGGQVHFVLPDRIGNARVLAGLEPEMVRAATEQALAAVA